MVAMQTTPLAAVGVPWTGLSIFIDAITLLWAPAASTQ